MNASIMQNKYNWPLWHWHLELSSICTLACPRCSRTEVKEGLVQTSLDINFIKKNFTLDILQYVNRISLCGYDGDPIYCKDFLHIVKYLKETKPTLELYIVTNGSYKTKTWWENLSQLLNEHDQIHWSLDGWDQESNEKYRINSNWDSIILGLEVFSNSIVYKTWDFIYFAHNYDKVDKVVELAKQYNFDQLRLTKSTKFGSKNNNYDNNGDAMEPPFEYISSSDRYENKIVYLTDRIEPKTSYKQALDIYEQIQPIESIVPLCKIGSKGLFINSQGYLFPCCWVVHRYDVKNYLSFLTNDINIHKVGLESALNSNKWNSFISNIPTNTICNMKCKSNLINKDVVGRW
jgi:MoaA/NifB/PqqE/SkfB family radical SAM enzyme